MTNEERIKADAEAYLKTQTFTNRVQPYEGVLTTGYIAGATAVHDRAQGLVDALEEIIKSGENIRATYKASKPPFYIKVAKEALAKWKGEAEQPQVELSCMVCGTKFMGPEPQMCCSGRDCGCMGLPVDPIVCSKECYKKGLPRQKGDLGVAIN